MTDQQLSCRAELQLDHLSNYLDRVVDRLASFDGTVEQDAGTAAFRYRYGSALIAADHGRLSMEAKAPTEDGLQRVRELMTVALQVHGKEDNPKIVWEGDLADERKLVTFRKMRVESAISITPNMRRIRLAGDDLARYGAFGGLHVRMLLPTEGNPDPVWPVAGPNGQPYWPSEECKPEARVYTIRRLDPKAGYMDIDIVVHGGAHVAPGVGSEWARRAKAGDEVGVIGPLGRPVRDADWYLIGCDETGLPAASRILEHLPDSTRGFAFVEVADEAEQQDIRCPAGMELRWIHRGDVPAGDDTRLADAMLAMTWPGEASAFGWFASEADAARRVRDHWRGSLSLGRDTTLVAGYWRRGQSGVMAG